MKTIKDRNKIGEGYCRVLHYWLKDNAGSFFPDKNNEADSWGDFERWSSSKTDRDHLIMPGEICLIDRMWKGRHAYVVCQFYGKECRKVRDLFLVIYIDELKTSDWRNGYFLIPDLTK